MTCNTSIAGLKKASYNQPIFDSTEQLYFRGNETKAHCDVVRQTVVHKPIYTQQFLTNEQLNGNFTPDDFLLSIPKPAVLKPESFHGNVAVNQYGLDHSWIMKVDNDHLLPFDKIDSFAINKTAPQLNLTPTINSGFKNALRNVTRLTVDGKPIGTDKNATKNVSKAQFKDNPKFALAATPLPVDTRATVTTASGKFKDRLNLAITQVDTQVLQKAARTNIEKRKMRNRIEHVIKTLAVKSKDPQMTKDVDKLLRENLDIIRYIYAYADKDPEFQLVIERLTKDHLDILRTGMEGFGYKKVNVSGKDLAKNIREAREITRNAPIAKIDTKGDFVKGVTPTCFLDDRFISGDQLEPLTTYAIEPSVAVPQLPGTCRRVKFEL